MKKTKSRFLRFVLLASIVCCIAAPGLAQFDTNGANAALTINGQVASSLDPENDVSICAPSNVAININSGSNQAAGVILLGSLINAAGSVFPTPWGGTLDIGMDLGGGQLVNISVIADGLGMTANPLLDQFFVTQLGSLDFVLPANVNLGGSSVALQSVVADPTNPPHNLDNTEAADLNFSATSDGFADTCQGALDCTGLSDADLGSIITVDTTTFSDTLDTIGLVGFGTQTSFGVVPAGMGLGGGSSSGTAPDAIALFTATNGGSYTFNLCNSAYDSRIWLMEADCVTLTGIVHNDDNGGGLCGGGTRSALTDICLAAGQEVLLVIDGFGSSAGIAEMTITSTLDPSVNGLDPSSGSDAGGDLVTITGCNLQGTTDVTFGGVSGAIQSVSTASVEVLTPAGSGNVDVVVDDGVLPVLLAGAYTFTSATDFSACSTPGLPIDGSVPHADTIAVVAEGNIGSLNVDIDITHTFIGDMEIDLTSPGGTVLRLHNGSGSGAANLVGNYPASLIPDGGGLSTGPSGDLTDFVGDASNGTWTLDIVDTFPASDDGTLNMWCVNGNYLSASSSPSIVINGSVPHSDTIAIATISTVAGLNVDIDITHTFIGDMEIDLTSPGGTILRLHNGSGSGAANIIGNYPASLIPDGGGPSTGPGFDLTDFNGGALDGTWTLDIVDSFPASDNGVLNSWGLNFGG